MWHELVLHGIGGRTIREAKESMTLQEAHDWVSYIRMRGPLNVGTRLEHMLAQLTVVLHRGLFKNSEAKLEDFLPIRAEQEPEQLDIKAVFAMLKLKSAQNKAK